MTSQRKILHVIAGAKHGGAETFCLDTIKALHERGIKQYVICRPHARYIEALRERNIPFTTLSFHSLERLFVAPFIFRKVLASFRPDIVHAWMGRAASFIPANCGVPVLGWFGGYYDLKRYKNCDFYMGVTRDLTRYIAEQSGKPEKTFLGHTFGTLEDDEPLNRDVLSTPGDVKVVLSLSRMHHKKGIDTLLHAAALLPDVHFWLAGDGPELEKYKALAKSLALGDRVRFLGWRNDRAALLAAADVCVLPSRYEPFGTVIAEAWYSKTPLVSTKAMGAAQYVTDRQNGLLCEIDDASDLACKINLALGNPVLRQSLSLQGYAAYSQLFNKDIVIHDLLKSYDNIMQYPLHPTIEYSIAS